MMAFFCKSEYRSRCPDTHEADDPRVNLVNTERLDYRVRHFLASPQSPACLYLFPPQHAEAGAERLQDEHSNLKKPSVFQEPPRPRHPQVPSVFQVWGQLEAAMILIPSIPPFFQLSLTAKSTLATFSKNTLQFSVTLTNTFYFRPVCILT